MCGIAGVLGPGHRQTVVPVTRALAHRGPDDEHCHHDETISLGQRRLSIIDLAGGRNVADGAEGPEADEIVVPPFFFHGGKRLAYAAHKGSGYSAVIDGVEGPLEHPGLDPFWGAFGAWAAGA